MRVIELLGCDCRPIIQRTCLDLADLLVDHQGQRFQQAFVDSVLVDEAGGDVSRLSVNASLDQLLVAADVNANLEGLDLLKILVAGARALVLVHLGPFLHHAAGVLGGDAAAIALLLLVRLEGVLLRLLLHGDLVLGDVSLVKPLLRLHVQHVPLVKLTVRGIARHRD